MIGLNGLPIPGTTSACAENTMVVDAPTSGGRNYLRVRGEYSRRMLGGMGGGNYLRVRGEYSSFPIGIINNWELPPRARRIQPNPPAHNRVDGTTSACAENTYTAITITTYIGNYLRVRGEYVAEETYPPSLLELPPRARRIHYLPRAQRVALGTTSACAENTGCYLLGKL